MKKSFLVTCALAVASIPSFAVTTNCLSGSVSLATLAAGSGNSCTLTNGANTWTLTEFRVSGMAGARDAIFSNYTGVPAFAPGDLLVNFATYNNGFLVNFSSNNQANAALFSAAIVQNGAQLSEFDTSFRILGNSGTAQITTIGSSINGNGPALNQGVGNAPILVVGTDPGQGNNAEGILTKFIGLLGTGLSHDNFPVGTNSLPGSANSAAFFTNAGRPLNATLLNVNAGDLFVVDRFRVNGGAWAGGSVTTTGYTNYFLPTAQTGGDIPEPMTFALMGAGLIGLAILRRRQK
jgi:hypothetical protein